MKELEAVERLKCMRLFMQIEDNKNECTFLKDDYIANDMAIKALEEVEQYRILEERLNGISIKQVVDGFIATVEKETQEGYECGRILSNKEAEEWNAYKTLGTIEEMRLASDKQNAKQVSFFGDGYADGNLVYDEYECPCCGARYELEYEEHKYCPECGQAMKIEFF